MIALINKRALYKIPTRITVFPDLPGNAFGKVVKPEIFKLFNSANRN